MDAAVYRAPGEITIEARPVPAAGPGELVIAVEHCGVCGTDLHLMLEGWGRPGSIEGHEFAGTVVEVGPDVAGWSVGQRVVGGPAARCGRCRHCLAGRPSLCAERDTPGTQVWQGAFAALKAIPAAEAIRVPDHLSLRAAALAEPLAVALHALTLAPVEPGQRVLVLGGGPIGALAVAVLRDRGVDHVVVCEPNQRRRDLAVRVGATATCLPDELEVPSIAEPGKVVDQAVDVVLECSGKVQAMEAGLAQLERTGTLVLVGSGIEPPRFDPNRIVLNELVVTGAFCYDAGGFHDAVDLLASGRLPVDDLIEPADVGLHGLLGALRGLAAGDIAGKVLVDPRLGATHA
ncbi:MAG TPA: alcohol dehydrogenase catalytic domain-containing protein [Acidimicrobiales bacterium]|jgi:(R,R)-butanediol dehydrogenase/meso-butanediol dehydrogenase/diacetyl reductase|nr:alcohol dehydrogenase catalytic domain-containing protein [Acidimicrobiales bacterium]